MAKSGVNRLKASQEQERHNKFLKAVPGARRDVERTFAQKETAVSKFLNNLLVPKDKKKE